MKKKYYPDVESNPNFPAMEEKILKFWQDNQVFKESVQNRPAKKLDRNISKFAHADAGLGDCSAQTHSVLDIHEDTSAKSTTPSAAGVEFRKVSNEYVFFDGPPFANGLPHYGHLLTGFVKDIFARYNTLKGKRVERRFGWDCHGLPAEMGVEKELGISGRTAITEYGIDKFNAHCRESVMKYASSWEQYVDRQGRWVDFKNDYKTMDISYMESVLWAFKQLYEKGLIYESMRVVPYSWACQTTLSNFETRMDNSYRQRADKAVTVAFNLQINTTSEIAKILPKADSYKILAWTTTPWTLPSNLALAVNPEIEYVSIVKEVDGNKVCYILADFAVSKYLKEFALEQKPELNKFKGSTLVELKYDPLLPFFKDKENAFRVLGAEFVVEGDGTGIVHLAPGFGEDDMVVCQKNNIDLVCPVDNGGKFTSEVSDFVGLQVFDANDEIIKRLKIDGTWFKTEQYLHNYPHCWRTDTPLIYKAVPSWYVKVTAFRERMVELNQQINWIPEHIKDGQFGKWLENAHDWSISRNRFWGSPIPVWRSNNPNNNKLYVFGSIAELEEFFKVKVTDLHRPFIDELTAPDPLDNNYVLKRVEDVFDCWFESGSMPYASVHYPFENKEFFEEHFPADFIVEYVAQTRGWFYTLMVLSTALFDRPPFKNCICHGVVLDTEGQKLSKRLNNYADPMELFSKYGADAMRIVMVSSNIMHGGELLIDKEGNMVRDAVRLVLKPIWNAYNFFTLYANSDSVKAEFSYNSDNDLDQYILGKCKQSLSLYSEAMENYDTPTACKIINDFYEVLNNWYIRRNKERFWKTEYDADKQNAYNTLYTVLHIFVRSISPLLPFISEEIYQGLVGENTSVHLADFPNLKQITLAKDNDLLLNTMDRVRDVCNAALSVRNSVNIRVRQPLNSLTVVAQDSSNISAFAELIKDELNVKNINYATNITEFANFVLKINFPVLGKRLPNKMKDIIAASKQGKWEKTPTGKIRLAGEELQNGEYELNLVPLNKEGSASLSSNDALVILDLTLSDALKREGIARDIVRLIQQSRKEANLHVSDYINLGILTEDSEINLALNEYQYYIAEQTLAKTINLKEGESYNHKFDSLLEGKNITVVFNKI